MALITIEQAKMQLRRVPEDTSADDDITMKMEAANAIVLDYIDDPARVASWEAGSPGSPGGGSPLDDQALTIVQNAILMVLERLWMREADILTDGIKSTLRRLREPTVA